jgi:Anti-sigma-K factor rskA/Putative zinc-finger
MKNLRRTEAHTLAGAYALDAVTGADRARFERHLARCQACARELRELREAAARLAAAVAAEPPADLVERAVAAAARTRQWPPPDTGQVRGRRTGARRGVSRRIARGVAAVFLAAAAASGAVAVTAEHHLGADQAREHAIAEVLNAPDAVMLTARITGGGTATVVMSHRDRALVFTAAGLPALPAGSCYELWLMGPAGDRPAGVLPAPDHGMTGPVIATGLTTGDSVGLTVAPVGRPGHLAAKPILMLSLA